MKDPKILKKDSRKIQEYSKKALIKTSKKTSKKYLEFKLYSFYTILQIKKYIKLIRTIL